MNSSSSRHGVYGTPPLALATVTSGARIFGPFLPGAEDLADLEEGALSQLVMLAPAGVLERRYALAQGLRAIEPGGQFTVMALKDKGGSRLRKELEAFGCPVIETSKAHHRICGVTRPASLVGIPEAIAAGAPRRSETLGLFTQPGIFSWDRPDPGTALLLEHLPVFSGKGADLGSGLGVLALAVLKSPKVTGLTLIDLDYRAVRAAQRNVPDGRAEILWADVRIAELKDLDFVVMNPPFHDGGAEDRSLGQTFIRKAAEALRKGGTCWLVANRHLPYEAVLAPLFAKVTLQAETGAFKVYEARK